MGDGGTRVYYFSNDGNNTNDCLFDYGSNTRLERLPDPTKALSGFRLTHADGRQDVYDYPIKFSTSVRWAFRTEEKNPSGRQVSGKCPSSLFTL